MKKLLGFCNYCGVLIGFMPVSHASNYGRCMNCDNKLDMEKLIVGEFTKEHADELAAATGTQEE